MDGLPGGVGARRISVLSFVRIQKSLGISLAVLTLCSRVLIAQSNQPDNTTPASEIRSYDSPNALQSYGVTSEEFERLVGLQPQTALPTETSVNSSPPPVRSVQPVESANPMELRSPFPGNTENVLTAGPQPNNPAVDFVQTIPYWQQLGAKAILTTEGNKICQVDLEQLIWLSMQYSPRVQSILIAPKIQRTDIDSARGEFDRRRIARTNYHDTSDPVGNTLTTGGPNRLNEQFWENSIGLRDNNTLGGKTELTQMFNARDNNSLFFKPNNQADTKLSLNYTQPLLRGSGRYYNTSSIRLAGIKTNESIAKANRELQNHAMDVINVYWEMVLHRYLLQQARNGQERLKQIKVHLLNREGRDLVQTHVSRANSAIANQQAQIVTAKANIMGLQESLRRLVNSPDLDQANCFEIVPLTMPATELPVFPLEEELLSALHHRGDILAIQETIQAAVVQRKLAANELRPQLDLDTSSYIRGLRGNSEFAQAYGNQFAEGRPSIAAGLTGIRPVGNRTSKANLTSRELELAKLQLDYKNELNKARADIISAIYSAQATFETTLAAVEGTFASRDEVNGQKDRFETYYGETPSISVILNDLLDAENRLIASENSWATKQIQHMLALVKIKYESGTLMAITAE